ncbi:hypothetical protein Esti_005406 [Eimeria stiedai]
MTLVEEQQQQQQEQQQEQQQRQQIAALKPWLCLRIDFNEILRLVVSLSMSFNGRQQQQQQQQQQQEDGEGVALQDKACLQGLEATRMEALQQKLEMVQQGCDPMSLQKRPLNRFLHPGKAPHSCCSRSSGRSVSDRLPHQQQQQKCPHPVYAEDAVFPQAGTGPRPLDFRSETLPLAGLVGRHQRKAFSQEERLEFVSLFNCIPGKTEGPQVRAAREALREREEALGLADMQQSDAPTQSTYTTTTTSSSGAAAAGDGCAMDAEDPASEALADLERQRIPVVVDGLKQRATHRPKGRFRPKVR